MHILIRLVRTQNPVQVLMLELNFTNTLKTFSCDIFRSLDLISEMMKDPQTLQFIQDCKQQLNHFFPLSEFLHRPIQRILKYPLLLRVRDTFLSVLITSAVSSNDNQLLWSLSKNVFLFPIVPISCYRQTGSLLKTFFMLLVVLVGFLLIFMRASCITRYHYFSICKNIIDLPQLCCYYGAMAMLLMH